MSTDVWELNADDTRYASLTEKRDCDGRIFRKLRGQPVGESWVPHTVYHYLPDETFTRILPFSDFPGFGLDPVFTPKSLGVLIDLLEPHGEILPLECPDGGEFYFYNVTTILDVLDHEHSNLQYFPHPPPGRIMRIDRYAFFDDRLEGAVIFRIKDLIHTICVTAPFVERVKEADLTGFDFKLLTE